MAEYYVDEFVGAYELPNVTIARVITIVSTCYACIKRKNCINARDGQRKCSCVTDVEAKEIKKLLVFLRQHGFQVKGHGYWIDGNSQVFRPHCSICLNDSPRKGYTPKYCPNCGAMMDGAPND